MANRTRLSPFTSTLLQIMIPSFRRSLVLFTLLFAGAGFLAAESDGPVAHLKSGDVQHFLKTMPQMITDLKKLGDEYGQIDDPSAMQGMMANDKAQAILKRYGWDQEQFLTKITAIASAFGAVSIQDELASLPEDQRKMMESMIGMQSSQLIMAHPDDIKLVRKHKAQLQAFFDTQ
jgi:hypothetical protein